MSICI